MYVRKLMQHGVACCGERDALDTAAWLMERHECGCLPVVDPAGRLTGILTDRDVILAAHRSGASLAAIPVSAALTPCPRSCRPRDRVECAIERMRDARVRRLPVVDDARRPVGIVSITDLVRAAAGPRGSLLPEMSSVEAARRRRSGLDAVPGALLVETLAYIGRREDLAGGP